MKILVVSWYMPPFGTMGALRVGKFCKFLHQQGHDVQVLSCADIPAALNMPLSLHTATRRVQSNSALGERKVQDASRRATK